MMPQVMLSGRHLRVSFQLGPLSDKQREKLQVKLALMTNLAWPYC